MKIDWNISNENRVFILLSVSGFALFVAWMANLIFNSLEVMPGESYFVPLLYRFFLIGSVSVVLYLAYRHFAKITMKAAAAKLVALATFLSLPLLLLDLLPINNVSYGWFAWYGVSVLGWVCSGCSLGLFTLLWGHVWSHLYCEHPKRAVYVVQCASVAIGCVTAALLHFADVQVYPLLAFSAKAIIPLVSGALCWCCLLLHIEDAASNDDYDQNEKLKRKPNSDPEKVLRPVTMGAMLSIETVSSICTLGFNSTIIVCIVGFLTGAIILLTGCVFLRKILDSFIFVKVSLFLTGVVTIAFMFGIQPIFAILFFVFYVASSLYFVSILSIHCLTPGQKGLSSFFFIGLTVGRVYGGILVGWGLGLFVANLGLDNELLCSLSSVVVLMLVLINLIKGTTTQQTWRDAYHYANDIELPAEVESLGDIRYYEHKRKEICESIAQKHGLTPREQEAFELLARGRNSAFLAESMIISQHTAKTHMYRIYKKLDINSQNELIDLVEIELQKIFPDDQL